jgi:hypothetical protein
LLPFAYGTPAHFRDLRGDPAALSSPEAAKSHEDFLLVGWRNIDYA